MNKLMPHQILVALPTGGTLAFSGWQLTTVGLVRTGTLWAVIHLPTGIPCATVRTRALAVDLAGRLDDVLPPAGEWAMLPDSAALQPAYAAICAWREVSGAGLIQQHKMLAGH